MVRTDVHSVDRHRHLKSHSQFLPARLRKTRNSQRHVMYTHHDRPYRPIRLGRVAIDSARCLLACLLALSLSLIDEIVVRELKRFQRSTPSLHSSLGGLSTTRTSQRSDLLHMPIINLNEMSRNGVRRLANLAATKVNQQNVRPTQLAFADERSKSTWTNEPLLSRAYRRNSLSSIPDETFRRAYQTTTQAAFSTTANDRQNNSFMSDMDHEIDDCNDDDNKNDDEDDDDGNKRTVDQKRRSSLLDDSARRLLRLGTIRPSKTFYKNLPEADVDHLMNYFRRLKSSNQAVSSEELNDELATTNVGYKPKICEFVVLLSR